MEHTRRREGLERLVAGSIVIVNYPFSDLSTTKRRPALAIKCVDDDIILLQITSIPRRHTLKICAGDIVGGSLRRTSFVRLNQIFTSDTSLILYPVGVLRQNVFDDVRDRLLAFLES